MEIPKAVPDLIKAKWPGVQGLYLYGSRARGENRPDSDVDLAVLAHLPLGAEDRFQLCQDIAALLHQDVDLVDLAKSSTVLQFQVVSSGQRIAVWDETACEKFEDLTYRMYVQLNEERSGILEDIRERGKIF